MTTRPDEASDAADTDDVNDQADQTTDTGDDAGDEEVRDPAQVLKDNRKLRREQRKTAERLEALEKELTGYREQDEASKSDQEKALDAARKEAAAEADSKWRARFVTAAVEARAARTFADPADAVRLIDLEDLDVDDTEAIDTALEELATAKPYLLRSAGDDEKTPPKSDAGNRGQPAAGGKDKSPSDWIRNAAGYR